MASFLGLGCSELIEQVFTNLVLVFHKEMRVHFSVSPHKVNVDFEQHVDVDCLEELECVLVLSLVLDVFYERRSGLL